MKLWGWEPPWPLGRGFWQRAYEDMIVPELRREIDRLVAENKVWKAVLLRDEGHPDLAKGMLPPTPRDDPPRRLLYLCSRFETSGGGVLDAAKRRHKVEGTGWDVITRELEDYINGLRASQSLPAIEIPEEWQ